MPRDPDSSALPGPAQRGVRRFRERQISASAVRACRAASGLLRSELDRDTAVRDAYAGREPCRGTGHRARRSIALGLAFGERWFAVNTQPFAEARAQRNLENQGFRTFMPRRRKMLRHARKLTAVEAPLFPRYLFIAFDPRRDQWRKINSTFGVSRLVMRGEAPHPVPDGVIEALIAVTVDGGIVDLAAKIAGRQPGAGNGGSVCRPAGEARTARRFRSRLHSARNTGPAGPGRQHERRNLMPARLTSRAVSAIRAGADVVLCRGLAAAGFRRGRAICQPVRSRNGAGRAARLPYRADQRRRATDRFRTRRRRSRNRPPAGHCLRQVAIRRSPLVDVARLHASARGRSFAGATSYKAELLFTGAPPFFLYFAVLAKLIRRVRLTYRITDFYPEVLIAEFGGRHRFLSLLQRTTWLLRRQAVDRFEVLGLDQRRLLIEGGIGADRIRVRRDISPVVVTGSEPALPRPPELANCKILLYSGNCGVAHEIETVIAGLARHHRDGSGRFGLWLNATGRNADKLEAGLRNAGVPVARGKTVPLDQLAGSADGCGRASGDIAAAIFRYCPAVKNLCVSGDAAAHRVCRPAKLGRTLSVSCRRAGLLSAGKSGRPRRLRGRS